MPYFHSHHKRPLPLAAPSVNVEEYWVISVEATPRGGNALHADGCDDFVREGDEEDEHEQYGHAAAKEGFVLRLFLEPEEFRFAKYIAFGDDFSQTLEQGHARTIIR